MDRFGRDSSSRFSNDESASLFTLSNERDPADEEGGVKDPLVSVTSRSSGDGSELSIEFAEYSRPRRRRAWWKRLLMTVRPRRTNRFTEERSSLRSSSKPARRRHVSVRAGGICLGLTVIVLAIFGIIHIWNYIIGLSPPFWDDGADFWMPTWGQPGEPGDGLARYPTDFTRDVLPIPCHSHNDYWRRVPLFEALHYGCTGVEADVWLFDDELYVGHDTASLTRNRTFRSLYVDQLVEILDRQNPQTEFNDSTRNGVFDEDPSQTLVLLVDFKNNGRDIYPYVIDQLSALREKNYLTYFDGSKVVQGPITVVGTGNTPFDLVTADTTHREIFFDAPLSQMWQKPSNKPPADLTAPGAVASTGQGLVGVTASDDFDSTNSYYASVNFRATIGILWRGKLSRGQVEKIRGQIAGAHARGLKARYWNAPAWPVGVRNHVWHVLVSEGADMLNVDDLRSAAKRDWRRRKERQRDS